MIKDLEIQYRIKIVAKDTGIESDEYTTDEVFLSYLGQDDITIKAFLEKHLKNCSIVTPVHDGTVTYFIKPL